MGKQVMTDQCIVILDARGIVRCCSEPQLLGRQAATLEGEALVALLPTLALSESTPDENIAYAQSWWVDGPWQSHALQLTDGPGEQLEICLRTVVLDLKPYLLAILRRPPAPDKGAQTIRQVFRFVRIWALGGIDEHASAVPTPA
jgi:hypothetical protein